MQYVDQYVIRHNLGVSCIGNLTIDQSRNLDVHFLAISFFFLTMYPKNEVSSVYYPNVFTLHEFLTTVRGKTVTPKNLVIVAYLPNWWCP